MATFATLLGPVTLVQLVIPAGTVVIVQVPVGVGAAAFAGPATVAVNTMVLARVAVETFAVTAVVGATGFTNVVCVAVPKFVE